MIANNDVTITDIQTVLTTAISLEEAKSAYGATCTAGWYGKSRCYDSSYNAAIDAIEMCYVPPAE